MRNPWKAIPIPTGTSYFKTIRVGSDENPADQAVSWAVDYQGNKAVYFEFPQSEKAGKTVKPPKFKSLMTRDIDCGGVKKAFAVILTAPEMTDLFYEICCDLIWAIQDIQPSSTRTVLIRRLERWSSLLKGGSTGLSVDSQRGLFAELLFLEAIAIPTMGEMNALNGWVGPERAYQDYHYGQTFVEVKSKHGASSSSVTISSEHQLATNESESLFLFVLEENDANGSSEGLSLTQLVTRIKDSLGSPLAKNEFISKLLSVGYEFEVDYDARWTIGEELIFQVCEGFPRLVDVGKGLSRVSYSLDLKACTEYLTTVDILKDSLRG